MTAPRFFVHLASSTVEEMIDVSARHGVFVEARGYLPPSRLGVYGSVEVTPATVEEGIEES